MIHHHAIIRKALDYAYKMDIIPNNPADKVQRPKKEQYIGSFYNENELNELFEKSKDDPLNLMIRIASYYGLRRSEVLGLKWDAFDFNTKTITIKHTVTIGKIDGKRQIYSKDRTKNKSSYRTLPLIPEIEQLLLEKKHQQEEDKKLFGNSYKNKEDYILVDAEGKLILPDRVTKTFRNLLKDNGLKKIRFHDLRHTYAVNALRAGDDIKTVSENLWHATVAFTADTYIHLIDSMRQDSAARMERYIEAVSDL